MVVAKLCIWDDLTLSDASSLLQSDSSNKIKSLLEDILGISKNLSRREKILLDLYYYLVIFAKENSFREEQIAAFFSIVKKTHEKATETSFGKLDETISYFNSLLQCHSVRRPPFCVEVFKLHEASKIYDYVMKSYFHHYKLYKYAFTPKVVLNLSISYNNLESEEYIENENALEDKEELDCDDKTDEEEKIKESVEEDIDGNLPNQDDTDAVNELKSIIKSTIDEEVAKLRISINEKLKFNDSQVNAKINENNKSALSASRMDKKGKKK